MNSYSWMNRQHQLAGPPSQSATQLAFDTARNKQAADNLSPYRTANAGGQPPPNAYFTYPDGANRERLNWQTAAATHQVFFQQPTGVKDVNHLLQNSSTNTQTGNHCLPVNNEFQVSTEHNFQQNSFPNVSTQSSPNMMTTNTMYTQQNVAASWNQQVQTKPSIWRKNCNTVYDLPKYRGQTTNENINREPLHQAPTTAHAVYNQSPGQSGFQHGLSDLPPSYRAALFQSFINNRSSANSGQENLNLFSKSQKPWQYAPQISASHKTRGQANSSVQSLNFSRLHKLSKSSSRANQNPTDHELQQIIHFVDSRQSSHTAVPDSYSTLNTSLPYRGPQLDSNQSMEPATSTVVQTYNTKTSQPLPLHSGQFLPQTTQSGTHHIAVAPPPPYYAADVFFGTATGNGSGKKQSFIANSHEICEMLLSVQLNDSSIHSSPCCTGTRAVAVVQPLSQESCQVVSKPSYLNTTIQSGECTTTDESLKDPEKLCTLPDVPKIRKDQHLKQGFNDDMENNQVELNNKCFIESSAASSSDEPQDLLQKQLCSDDPGSGLAINMQTDQQVATAKQHPVTSDMLVSPISVMIQGELPEELSLVPTTQWTKGMIDKVIKDQEKLFKQETKCFPQFDCASQILSMFWDGSCKVLASKLRTGWYKKLITEVQEFNETRVTENSVILSSVEYTSKKLHNSCHILKDGEDYSEPVYTSSWLNINEQLDDIDKEFGLLRILRHSSNTLENVSQSDHVTPGKSIPKQIVSEEANNVLSKSDLKSVRSDEENQAPTTVSTLTPTLSLNQTDSAHSSDPYYFFEIKVLPPEEAKVIFEQVQKNMPDIMDIDIQPEEDLTSSVEDEPIEITDVTLKESKPENLSTRIFPLEQVCCIARWMEMVRLNTSSPSKCQCKKEQSHKNCPDKIADEEETTEQRNTKPHLIESETEVHSAMKEENQASDGENNSNHIMTFSRPEVSIDLSENIDLTQTHLHDTKPTDISLISINDSQSSIVLISQSEDEDDSSSENEIPEQIPDFVTEMKDPEEDSVQNQLKSAGSSPSRHSDNSNDKISTSVSSSDVSNQMSGLDGAQAQLMLEDVTESSLQPQEDKPQTGVIPALQIKFNPSGQYEVIKGKRKTPSENDEMFPSLKESKKFKPSVKQDSRGFFKAMKFKKDCAEASATNIQTVELMLFGSAPQRRCVSFGSRQSNRFSPKSLSVVQMPPEVLSVHLSPLKRTAHVPTGAYSVKQRLHEKWRRSFPPTKMWQRSKLKMKKCAFASLSAGGLRKAKDIGLTKTTKLPASSEVRNENSQRPPSLKKKRALCNRYKIGRKKTKKKKATLKQLTDEERSGTDSRSHAAMPRQENGVLRFDVLPENFNFEYGSSNRRAATNPVSDIDGELELDKEKDNWPSRTPTKTSGTWNSNPAKKNRPLRSPSVPNTCSLFQEFQKKYKEKKKPANRESF